MISAKFAIELTTQSIESRKERERIERETAAIQLQLRVAEAIRTRLKPVMEEIDQNIRAAAAAGVHETSYRFELGEVENALRLAIINELHTLGYATKCYHVCSNPNMNTEYDGIMLDVRWG